MGLWTSGAPMFPVVRLHWTLMIGGFEAERVTVGDDVNAAVSRRFGHLRPVSHCLEEVRDEVLKPNALD